MRQLSCEEMFRYVFKSLYASNFEKVDRAYCFWSVRVCVGGSHFFVPTVTFKPLKLKS